MSETTISGAEFKKQLRDGVPKLGLFVKFPQRDRY
jgi:hypothetical protein